MKLIVAALVALAPLQEREYAPLRADGNGNPALVKAISVHVRSERIGEALRLTARRAGLDFSAADLAALDRRVSLDVDSVRVSVALLRLVQGTDIELLATTSGTTIIARAGARPRDVALAPPMLHGVVRDSVGNEVLADALVELSDRNGQTIARTTTTVTGAFALRGAAGASVSVRRLGYLQKRIPLGEVTRADTMQVQLAHAALPLSAVVVSPGFFGVMEQRVDARQTLTREQIRMAPQVGEDLFRSVNRLPGVTASDFSAAFRVRGGANRELYASLDGQELIEPFHLKDFDGALSVIDVGAIAGLDLTTGGFGARYGDRLTGVMSMRSIDPPPGSNIRTELALTLTTMRATSRGAFAGDRGAWVLSARRGFIEYALRAAGEEDNLRPRYYDLLGKVTYRVNDAATVSLHVLRAGDKLDYQDNDDKPRIVSAYGSTYLWSVAHVALPGGVSVDNVASAASLDWRRDGTRFSNFDGARDLTVHDERSLGVASVRQDWSWDLSPAVLLTWGGEVKAENADYDYDRQERRLAALNGRLEATNAPLGVAVSPSGSTSGAYLSLRAKPATRLTVEVGGRVDRQSYTAEHQLTPRAGIAFDATEHTAIRAAWGRYAQPQAMHELQTLDGATAFHGSELAEQRTVGFEHRIGGASVVRLEAYDRRMVRAQPRWVSVDNSIDVFPEIEPDRLLLNPSGGSARGVELLVSRSPGRRVTWSASYALAKATDVVGGRDVPRALDQRHTIALDAGFRPSRGWQISAAWLYHTGWPTTPFHFVADTLTDGRVLVDRAYEARNSERFAPYHRLDLRATRDLSVRGTRVSMFLDLFNVYDRRNARAYDPVVFNDNGRLTFGKAVDALLPRLPSFGLSWEF